MRPPHLFSLVHGNHIFALWKQLGRPPFVTIVPQEPLGRVVPYEKGQEICDVTVTAITIRCLENRDGMVRIEAASAEDLEEMRAWSIKHKDTPIEEFQWRPGGAS